MVGRLRYLVRKSPFVGFGLVVFELCEPGIDHLYESFAERLFDLGVEFGDPEVEVGVVFEVEVVDDCLDELDLLEEVVSGRLAGQETRQLGLNDLSLLFQQDHPVF